MGCCASEDRKEQREENKNDKVNQTLDEVYRKYDKDGSGGLDKD